MTTPKVWYAVLERTFTFDPEDCRVLSIHRNRYRALGRKAQLSKVKPNEQPRRWKLVVVQMARRPIHNEPLNLKNVSVRRID